MIPDVDRLESFNPSSKNHGYYIRTLVNLRVLPTEYKSEVFDWNLHTERDLKIPQDSWGNYTICPCWIYSNKEVNSNLTEEFKIF